MLTATYRGSKQALSLVALDSDCRHQVKAVTSGHRIALTYNLLLRSQVAASGSVLDAKLVHDSVRCLAEHFASSEGPDRLVYLLDHECTRRGLDWQRLKGTDAQRATLLAAAAQRAECDQTLALADVHETWSAYEPERRHRRWSRSGNWGNTLDRWYHRGAVVVWPRGRAFVVQAEAAPSRALDELAARVREGDLASARKAADSLAPLWGRVAAQVESKSFLAKALRAARVVDDPQRAAMLLRPFRLQTLSPATPRH